MRNKFIFNFIFLVCLDQITKAIFAARDFFFSILHVHLVKNYGLSFGLNFGVITNFVVLSVALLIFLLYIRKNSNEKFVWISSLILAGAASNLLDRLYLGYVRDFIDLSLGFTFNLADLFIVLGLIIFLFISRINSGNQEKLVE
jgi:signal peptidase II